MRTAYIQEVNGARLILNISVAAFLLGEVSRLFHLRSGATQADLVAELLFRALFFAGILLIPVGQAVAPGAVIGGGVWSFSAGVAIGWLGLLLRWWSFVALGKYFTVVVKTSEDQQVIDRGPYRVLRHPSYTGLLLAFVGCGLMLGNWVSTAGSVTLLLIALVYRIRVEERALDAMLGKAYRDFAAVRARLIPHVW